MWSMWPSHLRTVLTPCRIRLETRGFCLAGGISRTTPPSSLFLSMPSPSYWTWSGKTPQPRSRWSVPPRPHALSGWQLLVGKVGSGRVARTDAWDRRVAERVFRLGLLRAIRFVVRARQSLMDRLKYAAKHATWHAGSARRGGWRYETRRSMAFVLRSRRIRHSTSGSGVLCCLAEASWQTRRTLPIRESLRQRVLARDGAVGRRYRVRAGVRGQGGRQAVHRAGSPPSRRGSRWRRLHGGQDPAEITFVPLCERVKRLGKGGAVTRYVDRRRENDRLSDGTLESCRTIALAGRSSVRVGHRQSGGLGAFHALAP